MHCSSNPLPYYRVHFSDSPEEDETKSSGMVSEERNISLRPNPPVTLNPEIEAEQMVDEVDLSRSVPGTYPDNTGREEEGINGQDTEIHLPHTSARKEGYALPIKEPTIDIGRGGGLFLPAPPILSNVL